MDKSDSNGKLENNVPNFEQIFNKVDKKVLKRKIDRTIEDGNGYKRLPIIIIVDTSLSMSGSENLLKQSVEDLYATILNNPKAKIAAEIAIISFNTVVEVLQPMKEIIKQEAQGRNLEFKCEGETLTGLALGAAIEQIEERLKVYSEARPRRRHYAPILIFISDGRPECYNRNVEAIEKEALKKAKAYLSNKVKNNEWVVLSIEVGDSCVHELMTEITGLSDDRHVYKIENSSRLRDIFNFTSQMIVSLSTSHLDANALNEMTVEEMKTL